MGGEGRGGDWMGREGGRRGEGRGWGIEDMGLGKGKR